MPFRLTAGKSVRDTQRFNPLNTNAYTAKRHVYDEAIRVTAPPSKGRGIYKRGKEEDI